MIQKINCFVSYCYDKIDRQALDYFIKQLKDKRQFPDLQIFYDLEQDEIRNWDKFIENINKSQVVLLICSPKYKEKTINHSGSCFCDMGTLWCNHRNRSDNYRY